MPREQINLRCSTDALAAYRKAAEAMGYGPREFSQWVRDACSIYAGLLELEEVKDQRLVEMRRELERARRKMT